MSMLVVQSERSAQSVIDALRRAAFHLRKQGYSGSDREQADLLDGLLIHVTDPDPALNEPDDPHQPNLL